MFKQPFEIKKALNNNVVIAIQEETEVVLIGKGIGFGKKKGDTIEQDKVDKCFVLINSNEQEQYKQLLYQVDEEFIGVMNDAVRLIERKLQSSLNEHIHVALTDHISFAVNRLRNGLDIKNPFLIETQTLYPDEYTVAEEVVELVNRKLNIELAEGEIGFVTLHIHSAVTDQHVSDINKHSRLISTMIKMIEESLEIIINRESINYLRLVRHLRHAIERIQHEEQVEQQEKLANVLKKEYPICYNLSWKLIKVMQQVLQKPISDAEAVYLTMHLQRLSPK
ncbi:glucose PTS transporter transcription antiterminator GlcT [Bacillus taeanensis]|uniref:PtsGHI operon antiterminator n=1 Tax=Bacillus taeanensis TaxID=273032 RepID=A0A366Y3G9_9BACI|nr:transcription antiterminator [Bacillus taeanensis]RBW71549.1 PtsGHI operon antiterminator [Bacillus taeanensis]